MFLKKRMEMEADYGRNLQKLARNTAEMYGQHDAKAGCVLQYIPLVTCGLNVTSSFMSAWKQTLQLHENIAASHIKMAQMLKEQIDELNKVIDNSERERKQVSTLFSQGPTGPSLQAGYRRRSWPTDMSVRCRTPSLRPRRARIE